MTKDIRALLVFCAVLFFAVLAGYQAGPWAVPWLRGGGVAHAQQGGGNVGAPGTGNSGYPQGATVNYTQNTATTGGIIIGLGAASGQYSYLCGFSISPGSATTAITLTVNVSNIIAAQNLTWAVGAPVTAVGTTGAIFSQTFTPCLRASALNSGPGLSVSALGTGGVNQSATMWGYIQ